MTTPAIHSSPSRVLKRPSPETEESLSNGSPPARKPETFSPSIYTSPAISSAFKAFSMAGTPTRDRKPSPGKATVLPDSSPPKKFKSDSPEEALGGGGSPEPKLEPKLEPRFLDFAHLPSPAKSPAKSFFVPIAKTSESASSSSASSEEESRIFIAQSTILSERLDVFLSTELNETTLPSLLSLLNEVNEFIFRARKHKDKISLFKCDFLLKIGFLQTKLEKSDLSEINKVILQIQNFLLATISIEEREKLFMEMHRAPERYTKLRDLCFNRYFTSLEGRLRWPTIDETFRHILNRSAVASEKSENPEERELNRQVHAWANDEYARYQRGEAVSTAYQFHVTTSAEKAISILNTGIRVTHESAHLGAHTSTQTEWTFGILGVLVPAERLGAHSSHIIRIERRPDEDGIDGVGPVWVAFNKPILPRSDILVVNSRIMNDPRALAELHGSLAGQPIRLVSQPVLGQFLKYGNELNLSIPFNHSLDKSSVTLDRFRRPKESEETTAKERPALTAATAFTPLRASLPRPAPVAVARLAPTPRSLFSPFSRSESRSDDESSSSSSSSFGSSSSSSKAPLSPWALSDSYATEDLDFLQTPLRSSSRNFLTPSPYLPRASSLASLRTTPGGGGIDLGVQLDTPSVESRSTSSVSSETAPSPDPSLRSSASTRVGVGGMTFTTLASPRPLAGPKASSDPEPPASLAESASTVAFDTPSAGLRSSSSASSGSTSSSDPSPKSALLTRVGAGGTTFATLASPRPFTGPRASSDEPGPSSAPPAESASSVAVAQPVPARPRRRINIASLQSLLK